MSKNALFDDEAKKWESLYSDSSRERWGIFQGSVRRRTQARMDLCLSLLPPLAGKSVIELGCGPGYYGLRLIRGGGTWTGLDISARMLAVCRDRTGSRRIVCGDVLALPFRRDACDILLCIGVVSYLKICEISELFSQAFDAVRKGGVFLVQTVRFDPFTWVRCRLPRCIPRPLRIPGPFYPRSPRTIARLLEENGFRLQSVMPYRKYIVYPAGTIYLAEKDPKSQ